MPQMEFVNTTGQPVSVSAAYPVPVTLSQSSSLVSGELAGSASAIQLPDISCRMVKFKALSDNAGNVYIGAASVTKPDGTTDVTTGLQLAPGDDSGWLIIDNLNCLYRICDNAGDDLTYVALK